MKPDESSVTHSLFFPHFTIINNNNHHMQALFLYVGNFLEKVKKLVKCVQTFIAGLVMHCNTFFTETPKLKFI